MKVSRRAAYLVLACTVATGAVAYADSHRAQVGWSDLTTASVTGYCLAKHPYQTLQPGAFTADGYEVAASPGIVGAVRRNFIYERSADPYQGQGNSCADACAEFGKLYGANARGLALKQKLSDGRVQSSGIGDIATLAVTDQQDVAGIWSRSTTFHEGDVAKADLCCCHVQTF